MDSKHRKLFVIKQLERCKFMPKMHQNTFGVASGRCELGITDRTAVKPNEQEESDTNSVGIYSLTTDYTALHSVFIAIAHYMCSTYIDKKYTPCPRKRPPVFE